MMQPGGQRRDETDGERSRDDTDGRMEGGGQGSKEQFGTQWVPPISSMSSAAVALYTHTQTCKAVPFVLLSRGLFHNGFCRTGLLPAGLY